MNHIPTTTTKTTTRIDSKTIQAILKLFAEAKELYAPGGAFMAGTVAELKRGRTRAITGGMQGLVAAGLAGTSMAGGLAKKYEEEVGAPTMARATTARLGALASLLQAEAGIEVQTAPRTTTQQVTSPLLRTLTPTTSAIPAWQQQRDRADALWQQITQPRQTTQPRQATQPRRPGFGRAPRPTVLPGLNLLNIRRPVKQAPITSPLSSFYGGNISSINFDPGGELSI